MNPLAPPRPGMMMPPPMQQQPQQQQQGAPGVAPIRPEVRLRA